MHLEISILQDLIVPNGPDSFYHAKRILNILETGSLIQFDPFINAPYGEYVSWPWAYDSLIALLTHMVSLLSPGSSQLAIMVMLPPFMVFLNSGLIVIMCQVLRLSPIYILIALIIFSISPLTQNLHMIGRLDHHMIEFSFVIGALILGVQYFRNSDSRNYAIAYGALLGAASAFHNGLFILQLPFLATLFFLWVMKTEFNKTLVNLGCSLLLATFIFLLPSEPFRSGYVNYYFHSWFHLYIAFCTLFISYYFFRFELNRISLTVILFICSFLAYLVITEFTGGIKFITGDNQAYLGIDEFSRPISWVHSTNLIPRININEYSGLLVLLPISILILIRWSIAKKQPYIYFFVISSVFGVVLLLAQYRLNYFGSFVLYIPLLLICSDLSKHLPNHKKIIFGCLILILGICYYPVKENLLMKRPFGGSFDYQLTHKIYDELGKSCKQEPGTVLADYNDGHFISFHTNCAVIANNFLITKLDFDRVRISKSIFSGGIDKLLQNKWIDYVYVRREDNIYNSKTVDDAKNDNSLLVSELLFSDKYPDNFKLIANINYINSIGEIQPLAKAFKIYK
jgi:hypothetical protein